MTTTAIHKALQMLEDALTHPNATASDRAVLALARAELVAVDSSDMDKRIAEAERRMVERALREQEESAHKPKGPMLGLAASLEAQAKQESTKPSGSIKETLATFDALLAAQGGKCAICETKDPGSRGWTFDRSHYTKTKRSPCAVLCPDCNVMLDYAKDSTRVLESAVKHLLRSPV